MLDPRLKGIIHDLTPDNSVSQSLTRTRVSSIFSSLPGALAFLVSLMNQNPPKK